MGGVGVNVLHGGGGQRTTLGSGVSPPPMWVQRTQVGPSDSEAASSLQLKNGYFREKSIVEKIVIMLSNRK